MRGWLVFRYPPDAWALDTRDFRPADGLTILHDAGFAGVQSQCEDAALVYNRAARGIVPREPDPVSFGGLPCIALPSRSSFSR
jgi:hypothetical protein